SPNSGKLLENLVFLELRRKNHEVYYFSSPGGYEVDFYLPEQRQLVQVAHHLDHPDTREREVRALRDAIGTVKVDNALILTETNGETFKLDGVPVNIRSTAEWLLMK